MEKKKESNGGLLFLLLFILFGAVGFIFYYKLVMTRIPEILTPDQKLNYTEEQILELYNRVKLDYSEESVLTKEDYEKLNGEFLIDNFSSSMRIYYGIRQVDEKEYGKEELEHEFNGYKYTGTYIKGSTIKTALMRTFGINTFTNTNVFVGKTRYYYVEGKDIYRIYEIENYEPKATKLFYYEYTWDENNIYLTEYSAYTSEKDGVKYSYTKHNRILPIVITKKNITENLDIIDEYKYTFTLNTNVNKFFISRIDYISQNILNDENLTNE